jgi:diguanylate cyclase (GGDEF)-like protein
MAFEVARAEPGRRPNRRPPRSPAAWSSACLYLVACALLLTGALAVPMGDRIAHPVDAGLSAACAGLAGLAWFGGRRMDRQLPHVVVLLGIAVITAAITVSHTLGGETFPAFGYLWTTVYLAYFLPLQAVLVYLGLIAASSGAAFVVAGSRAALEAWVVVTASVVVVALVLHQLVNLLARQAEEDTLMGLLNRTGLERRTAAVRMGCSRRGSPVTLVAIDLDGFKAINDRLGHVRADDLLVELADHWRGRLRRSDLAARIGGDEFALVLPDTGPDQAAAVLDGLRAASPLSWSAGTTELRPGEAIELAYARADAALYEAKGRPK